MKIWAPDKFKIQTLKQQHLTLHWILREIFEKKFNYNSESFVNENLSRIKSRSKFKFDWQIKTIPQKKIWLTPNIFEFKGDSLKEYKVGVQKKYQNHNLGKLRIAFSQFHKKPESGKMCLPIVISKMKLVKSNKHN